LQEFDSLRHLAQRLSNVEARVHNPRGNTFQKKVNNIEYSSDSEGEAEIGLAEWTKNKEPVLCPFAKKDAEKYEFDVNKADKIFDLLLQEGQIKLSPNHTIPTTEELKNCKYCNWHNAVSTTLMSAKCSVSRFNRLWSKGGLNLKILQSR
jgi:hypothetical protein